MDVIETGYEGVEFIQMAPDEVQWRHFFEHGNEADDSIKTDEQIIFRTVYSGGRIISVS